LPLARVIKRDNITRELVEAREAKQFTEDKKRQLADYIIENDESQLLIPQVLALHDKFLALTNL
jgi:dephospho-CoA kinase